MKYQLDQIPDLLASLLLKCHNPERSSAAAADVTCFCVNTGPIISQMDGTWISLWWASYDIKLVRLKRRFWPVFQIFSYLGVLLDPLEQSLEAGRVVQRVVSLGQQHLTHAEEVDIGQSDLEREISRWIQGWPLVNKQNLASMVFRVVSRTLHLVVMPISIRNSTKITSIS